MKPRFYDSPRGSDKTDSPDEVADFIGSRSDSEKFDSTLNPSTLRSVVWERLKSAIPNDRYS